MSLEQHAELLSPNTGCYCHLMAIAMCSYSVSIETYYCQFKVQIWL